MTGRPFPVTIAAVLFLFFSRATTAAVFIVPPDEQMIREAEAIVLGHVDATWSGFATNGDIVTYARIVPQEILKGTLPAGAPIEIRDSGGVVGSKAMQVSGGVTYVPGERALIFLVRDDEHYLTTYGLMLGKMLSVVDSNGNAVLTRTAGGDVVGLQRDGVTAHIEVPRPEGAFLALIRRRVGRQDRERPIVDRPGINAMPVSQGIARLGPSLFSPEPQSHYPASAYTQGTFRWDDFDAGGSVTYYSSGTQPGYDSVGAAQRALAGWTNDPNSTVRFVYGGSRSTGFVEDGVNSIVYNSTTGVPAGAVGYSKWYADALHTYQGESFYSISEGDVVIKAGISVTQKVFDEIVAHEIGHTLGFRHSDQGTPTSGNAIMRSAVTGNWGTVLSPWDVEAVTHVYGSTTTPPSCTPPTVSTPQSSTIEQGTSTTLSVTAGGTQPLTFQWYIGPSGTTSNPAANGTGSSITVSPSTTTQYWIRVSNACGSANSSAATVTVTAAGPRMRGDFNGDGNVDIVWRNNRTGANRIWLMDADTLLASVTISSIPDSSWEVGGVGDFNEDGHQDLVWRQPDTGYTRVWFMNDTSYVSTGSLPTVGREWVLRSVNDWNHDRSADLIWRRSSGVNPLWYLNGLSWTAQTYLPSVSATIGWSLAATGDATGDGIEDVIWRNTDGRILLWRMSGPTRVGSTLNLPSIADLSWTVAAMGKYDANDTDDIVLYNTRTGEGVLWFLTPGTGALANTRRLAVESNTDWQIVAPR